MRIRDFYFASWVISKGYNYRLENSKLYITNLSKEEYKKLLLEYQPLKTTFSTVKKIIREINHQRISAISCRTK
jgi:hypothetical protein